MTEKADASMSVTTPPCPSGNARKKQFEAADEVTERQHRIEELCAELPLSDLKRRTLVRAHIDDLENGESIRDANIKACLRAEIRNLANHATTEDDWRRVVEAIGRLEAEHPVDPDADSLGKLVEQFLEQKRIEESAGQRSAGRYANIRSILTQFQEWIGHDASVSGICSATVSSYYQHLLARLADENDSINSTYTAKGYFQVFKQFVRWLGEHDHLAVLPANLDSRH